MPSALEWYVLIVVMTFVSLFAVAHYAQWTANGALDRKWNTPVGWIIVAATVGVFTVGVLGVYGSTVPDPDRGEIGAYLFNMGPLVAGCIGLAVAAGHGRLVVLFRRAEQTRTAAVGSADAGTTVIVTGEVEALTQATSPALDQSGVCWSWAFDIRGTGEQRFDDPRPTPKISIGSGESPARAACRSISTMAPVPFAPTPRRSRLRSR